MRIVPIKKSRHRTQPPQIEKLCGFFASGDEKLTIIVYIILSICKNTKGPGLETISVTKKLEEPAAIFGTLTPYGEAVINSCFLRIKR